MARKKSQNRIVLEHLEVIDAGAKGKAIAKAADGRVVFINNAVPGDIVSVQTTKKRKAYFEGTAIEIHKASDKRVDPVCEHFGTCGGCKWQHMGYEHQLFFKQKEIENNLSRIGKVALPDITPILGAKEQYFYRNKMEFSFSDSKWLTLEQIKGDTIITDKNALGFHIPGMWDKILNLNKCHLQKDPSNAIRDFIKHTAEKLEIPFFNTRNQTGILRTLMLRTASTGELMVLLQLFAEDKLKREALLDAIYKEFPEITSLQYVINGKGNDTIYDQEVICYKGRDHIFEQMEGLTFKINAKSFYQTNSDQAYELYKVVRDFAQLKGDEVVYDLYTGTGTIANFVAKQAKQVIGVEYVEAAIEDAKLNSQLNGIENTLFYAGDMKDILNDEFMATHPKPDLIITDPPRAGMDEKVIQMLLRIAAPVIVYVSCNPATQARDLGLLGELYQVDQVQPVDMFPQTYHVENVVRLSLKQ